MRRSILVGLLFAGMLALLPSAAVAGSPHFISCTATIDGNVLTVDGKEAGLGDESQVHILVTATASCINPGSKHPKAENKDSFSNEGDFPVQNGKALFSIDVVATFQPDCTPPMSLVWGPVVVEDTTNDIFCTLQ